MCKNREKYMRTTFWGRLVEHLSLKPLFPLPFVMKDDVVTPDRGR